MIASVVAFVDIYRPKYAFLENVKGMAYGPETNNVLAHVISALVGMGYQTRTFALDAWNYGSAQSRSRIFISIAAPGLTPVLEPPHTHSHPENVVSASLGKLPNGLRFNSRYSSQTPFNYVTAEEAMRDLPATDGRISCLAFPDHRMSIYLSNLHRIQIASIPRFPRGNTFVLAVKEGYMPQAQIDAFDWSSSIKSSLSARGWQRVKRGTLVPTIMTEARPSDGINGTVLHWDDERLLTVMEVRRAQGFLDEEVLLGLPREQWKIVGNSVARSVALALGVSLREAWLKNDDKTAFDITSTRRIEIGRQVSNLSAGLPINKRNTLQSSPASQYDNQKVDRSHEYVTVRETSISDTVSLPVHTTNSPSRIITRETTVSEVTITTATTTTIVHRQSISSPEL